MKLAMIGLGKMGGNMTNRLLAGGHTVSVFDFNEEAVRKAVDLGAKHLPELGQIKEQLSSPRIVWIMVPAGDATESTIQQLSHILDKGDIVIDGGNSNYKDTVQRAKFLSERGIKLVDTGTSGGVWGLKEGYSMMIGGEQDAVEILTPIFQSLAPAAHEGWGHVGPSGAGHYVKMIHNGIEYGLMQAFAEGFDILKNRKEFDLDLHQIGKIWQKGSVVRSWLLDLTVNALAEDEDLAGIKGWVEDSGEGRWTVADAIDLNVPAPVITLSLLMRFASRQEDSYANKLLAAMRNQFGGHAVKPADSKD